MLTVALLPLTSPAFLHLGATKVKPLSVVAAAATLLLLGPAVLIRSLRGLAPVRRLVLFAAYAMTVGFVLALLADPAPLKGLTPIAAFARAVVALALGMFVYAAFWVIHRDGGFDLRRTDAIIFTVFAVSIACAFVQWIVYHLIPDLRPLVVAATHQITSMETGPGNPASWGRAQGLAYEPSWLASQLTVLVLPLALWRFVTCDSPPQRNLMAALVALALVGVLVTGSRGGLFAAAAISGITVLTLLARRSRLVVPLAAILLAVGVLAALILAHDRYLKSTYRTQDDRGPTSTLAPRLSVWESGIEVFTMHPVSGVGLGEAPFNFSAHVPAWSLRESEVRTWLDPDDPTLPNPKNLYVRLLEETGVVGALLFLFFALSHGRGRPKDLGFRILRDAAFIGLAVDYLSLDSFALPTQWVIFGYLAVLQAASPRVVEPPPGDSPEALDAVSRMHKTAC